MQEQHFWHSVHTHKQQFWQYIIIDGLSLGEGEEGPDVIGGKQFSC